MSQFAESENCTFPATLVSEIVRVATFETVVSCWPVNVRVKLYVNTEACEATEQAATAMSDKILVFI